MKRIFAQIISTVINPVILIALIPFLLIYKVNQDLGAAFYWSGISFIFIIIFSVFVLFGVKLGYFSNLDISNRALRPLLYSFAIVLSLIYLLFLFILHAPTILFMGIIALAMGLAVAELINTRIKASLHVGTLVAFITSLVIIYGFSFILAYVLVPLVAWARIETKKHTLKEVLVGGTVGFLLTIVVYIAFEYII